MYMVRMKPSAPISGFQAVSFMKPLHPQVQSQLGGTVVRRKTDIYRI